MEEALTLAREAAALGEVPVGAIVVRGGSIIGRGLNRPISSNDPTAHAEILALRDAAAREGNYRLPGSVVYVTIEPCSMCAGAFVHARVDRLVFGAPEPRAGAVISQNRLLDADYTNHKVRYRGGVLQARCAELMQQFFKERRLAKPEACLYKKSNR